MGALDLAEKTSFFLVSFINEVTDTAFARFTTLDSDYTFEGDDYDSEPRMRVQLPRNDGTFSDEECQIALPLAQQFAQDVSGGLRYPAVRVYVTEIVKGDGSTATNVLRPFTGLMTLARRKVGGRSTSVTISCKSQKSRLGDIALGQPCMQNCINRLGDGRCKVTLTTSPKKITVTVSEIDGPRVVVTGTVPTGLEDRFYQRGYMIRQGFEFEIRNWRNEVEGDRFEFFLFRRPPDSWVGQTVTVFAGCPKTPDVCESRFDNLSNFNAPGIKMPAYNPVFEDGAARQ